MILKSIVRKILSLFHLSVLRRSTLENLIDIISYTNSSLVSKMPLMDMITGKSSNSVSHTQIIEAALASTSQLGQDLFVLSQLGFKRNGFFVEFGATNGVDLSNTLLLERNFQWNGILAEPGKTWQKSLKLNREAHIDFSCIWSQSNISLEFNETSEAELSTIERFSNSDSHAHVRESGKRYSVETLSLNDLLVKYDSPEIIDYLSIDTEGSEYEILECLDFDKWKFRVITCEHNYTPNRQKIEELLNRNGYKRVLTEISKFDDWYVLDRY